MKGVRGFTTIELVMIIVVIGVLAMVALPKASAGSRVRLEAVCQKIASDLRYAQAMSMAQQVRFGISFDTTNEAYFVYRSNVSTKARDPQTMNDSDISFITLNEFKGIEITSTNFSDKIEFNSAGAPYDGTGIILSSQGIITLQTSDAVYSRTVRIEAVTGKISIQ